MTVKQAIEILSKRDPEDILVLSVDEEGNVFRAIDDISEGIFNRADSEYYDRDDAAEYRHLGVPATCVWPE